MKRVRLALKPWKEIQRDKPNFKPEADEEDAAILAKFCREDHLEFVLQTLGGDDGAGAALLSSLVTAELIAAGDGSHVGWLEALAGDWESVEGSEYVEVG